MGVVVGGRRREGGREGSGKWKGRGERVGRRKGEREEREGRREGEREERGGPWFTTLGHPGNVHTMHSSEILAPPTCSPS